MPAFSKFANENGTVYDVKDQFRTYNAFGVDNNSVVGSITELKATIERMYQASKTSYEPACFLDRQCDSDEVEFDNGLVIDAMYGHYQLVVSASEAAGSTSATGVLVCGGGKTYSITGTRSTAGIWTINAQEMMTSDSGLPALLSLGPDEIGQFTVKLSTTAAQWGSATFLITLHSTTTPAQGGQIILTVYTTSSQALSKVLMNITSTSSIDLYNSNSAVSGTDKHVSIHTAAGISATISLLAFSGASLTEFGEWQKVTSLPSDNVTKTTLLSVTVGYHASAISTLTVSGSTSYDITGYTSFTHKRFYLSITRAGPGTVLLTPRIIEFTDATTCIWREIGNSTWNTAVSSFTLTDGSTLTFGTVPGPGYGKMTLSGATSTYNYNISMVAEFDQSLTLVSI